MAIGGNPLSLARDVAEGYFSINPVQLKNYTPADMKIILNSLNQILREVRSEQIPPEEVMTIKQKNMKISRLNNALMLIQNHCRKLRIHL